MAVSFDDAWGESLTYTRELDSSMGRLQSNPVPESQKSERSVSAISSSASWRMLSHISVTEVKSV